MKKSIHVKIKSDIPSELFEFTIDSDDIITIDGGQKRNVTKMQMLLSHIVGLKRWIETYNVEEIEITVI